MDESARSAFAALIFLLPLLVLVVMVGYWAASDARQRGKPPFFVVIAVIFFFPWGWIAWLLFRPPPLVQGQIEFRRRLRNGQRLR